MRSVRTRQREVEIFHFAFQKPSLIHFSKAQAERPSFSFEKWVGSLLEMVDQSSLTSIGF
jgi:hypothetical protein